MSRTETGTHHVTEHKHGGLGELAATAISGNDITSSRLYVLALAILYAGVLAPIALLMVAGVLYPFRSGRVCSGRSRSRSCPGSG